MPDCNEKQKGIIVNSWEVKPFVLSGDYSSKMLLDDVVAGEKSIHINEGTLKPGATTLPGGTHEAAEIYYVVKGEATLIMDGVETTVKPGSVAFIPAGCCHALVNKSGTEDFVLLTLWENTKYNEVYHKRVEAWGKPFKTIYED